VATLGSSNSARHRTIIAQVKLLSIAAAKRASSQVGSHIPQTSVLAGIRLVLT